MNTILVIEDDPSISHGLQEALTAEHFTVKVANTGERGYTMARRENVDVIILDLKLPDRNGEDICRQLRAEGVNTLILMLTAKKQEMDKVLGLEIGADDYMTKPFSVRELVARIRALLRRRGDLSKGLQEYSFDEVYIDFLKHTLIKNGKPVRLSVREFEVLKYFIEREGAVVTRDMLLNEVWGYDQFPTTRTVDNYILSLRKKIEQHPDEPVHLLTVHTAGYRFVKDAGKE
jgi:DNA-binding response OmpR family regulator